jgi:hypothetical protein
VNADQEGNGRAGNDPAPRRVAIVRLGGYNVRRCTLVSCQPVRARRQKRQDGHRNYVPVDLLNSPAGRAHEPGKEAHGLGSLEEQVMLGSCGPGRGLWGERAPGTGRGKWPRGHGQLYVRTTRTTRDRLWIGVELLGRFQCLTNSRYPHPRFWHTQAGSACLRSGRKTRYDSRNSRRPPQSGHGRSVPLVRREGWRRSGRMASGMLRMRRRA